MLASRRSTVTGSCLLKSKPRCPRSSAGRTRRERHHRRETIGERAKPQQICAGRFTSCQQCRREDDDSMSQGHKTCSILALMKHYDVPETREEFLKLFYVGN